MSKYLIKVQETYRADTEKEAEELINEAKNSTEYTLIKYHCEAKEKKQKGDIVDEWFRVVLDKAITDEKEPDTQMNLIYTTENMNGQESLFWKSKSF